MKLKCIVSAILFLCCTAASSRAQAILGARFLGLGNAATALPGTVWSVFANPAMVDDTTSAFSFFGIRYYGFSELTDMAAVLSYPAGFGVIGAGVHRYGFELFSENRIRIVYKNAFQQFHYGIVVNYNHVSQGGGYGSAGTLGLDIGLAASIADRIWMGARATNVNQPEYGSIGEELPRELAVGMSYRLAPNALFTSEVAKDVRFPASFRGGVEVIFLGRLSGRAGFGTEPATFALGFGYAGDRFDVNVAAQNHVELGISPGVDLSVRL